MSIEEKKTIHAGDSTGGDEVFTASLQQPDMTSVPVSAESENSLQDLTYAELEAVIGGASSSGGVSVSVNGTGDVVATNPGAQAPLSK